MDEVTIDFVLSLALYGIVTPGSVLVPEKEPCLSFKIPQATAFSAIERKQCLKGFQVIPMDNEIVMEADLVSQTLVLYWNQLMVFDEQMMVLNERFAFKLNLRHSMSPSLDLYLIYSPIRWEDCFFAFHHSSSSGLSHSSFALPFISSL